jgi:multidrug transporter EmrE-like cation transporter
MFSPLVSGSLLTAVEAFGNTALKKYALGAGPWVLGVGVGIYGILAGLLAWLFKFNGLAITNAMWDATSNVMTMGIGYFLFHESYTIKQWIGMGTISLGILLMK